MTDGLTSITLINRHGWRLEIESDYASSPTIRVPEVTTTGVHERIFIWNGNRNQLVYRERIV